MNCLERRAGALMCGVSFAALLRSWTNLVLVMISQEIHNRWICIARMFGINV